MYRRLTAIIAPIAIAIPLAAASARTTQASPERPPDPAPAELAVAVAEPLAPPLLVQPITLDRSNRMTLPVSIAGQGPFGFIVDTGSERTVLSRQLALRLGLASAGQARVVGMADTVTADLYRLDGIGLSTLSLGATTVPVFEQGDIGGPGLIGINTLENHKLVIDFRSNRMDIRESPPTRSRRREADFDPDTIVVTARRLSGRMILSNARLNGRRIDIVLDTGAQSSVGNIALQRLVQRQPGQRRGGLIPGELRSVTGQTLAVQHGQINRITIAGVDLNDLPVAYADSPAFAVLGLAERPTLLLGMDALALFDRIAIDFTNRRVSFDLPDGVSQLQMRGRMAHRETGSAIGG
jgi:predicted aspartyl protease